MMQLSKSIGTDYQMKNEHDMKIWIDNYKTFTQNGQCASYIPALAKANPAHLGVVILGPDGTTVRAGDSEIPFTMQSISKVISFLCACQYHGISRMLEWVDVEPTGDAFNSIVRLEMNKPGKPFNPMINAGAINVAGMLPGKTPSEKVDSLVSFLSEIIDRKPEINMEVFQSEWETAYRNRALAFYLKEMGYLNGEVDDILEVYLKQCSIEIHTKDLAQMGLVLALDGYHPFRKKQILSKELTRIAKALMLTCGMYNASGKFAAFVGVPAKSGVSGGILASIPPRGRNLTENLPFNQGCGIGIYGPSIDDVGNSTAGVMLLQHIVKEWDFSIF